MKKIISLLICVCLLIPLFVFFANAEDEGEAATPVNVAANATIGVSSCWNDYTPPSSINDGKLYGADGVTVWRPNNSQRDESLVGISPYFTMTLDTYYLVSEVTLQIIVSDTDKCTVTIEALVNGAWTELDTILYQSVNGISENAKVKNLTAAPTEAVNTNSIRVTFSNFTEWDTPQIYECAVLGIPGTVPEKPPVLKDYTNIAHLAVPDVYSNYYQYSSASCLNDNIIDGQINETNSSYIFWRPQTPQRDPTVEGTDPWFTLKFDEYMEITEISVLVELVYSTECVLKFEALVAGEWIVVGTSQFTTSEKFEDYKRVRDVLISIPETITTKKLRVTFSDYISWDPPFISECRVTGAVGEAPEFDVPEGAYLSTNAALSGYAEASSSAVNRYPALGNDDKTSTSWAAKSSENNQWYMVKFNKEYSVGSIFANFSTISFSEEITDEGYKHDVKIELLVDSKWTTYFSGEIVTSEGVQDPYETILENPVNATAIRITYVNTNGNIPVLTEIGAITSDGSKCIFIGDILDIHKKSSTAGGNLACYGTPYAESTFTFAAMSDVSYITDGLIHDQSYIWVAETSACPVYCGVKLSEVNKVDTVVLYFNDDFGIRADGVNHVLSFDVYCKDSNGNFVKVGSGTSYDKKANRAVVSVTFAPVMTDDVRIVFTSNGGRLPYLKELEVYGHNDDKSVYVYPHYDSLPTNRGIPYVTEDFAEFTVAPRSEFMDRRYKRADMKDIIKNRYESMTYSWLKTDPPKMKEEEEK